MTQARDDVVGLDASIIMHPKIWEASGHTSTFSDLMVDCLLTRKRFRADQIEPQSGTAYFYTGATDAVTGKQCKDPFSVLLVTGWHPDYARKVARQFYQQRGLQEPGMEGERSEPVRNSTRYNPENGSLLTEPRPFNLMLKTCVGPVESPDNVSYLRPETAQAIFVQFRNVLEVSRQRLPFGICQIGKAFRNEINPRNFTFRSREFEQMELEFFIKPDEAIEAVCGHVAAPAGPATPATRSPTGAGSSGTNTGSRSASAFTRASACPAPPWSNTGKSRTNWPIMRARRSMSSTSSPSASATQAGSWPARNWRAFPPAAISTSPNTSALPPGP